MDEWAKIAWLHRRAGFGLRPDEIEPALENGADAELQELVTRGITESDPWEELDLDPERPESRPEAVRAWLLNLLDTDDVFVARRTFLLHGWLVSSMAKVNRPDAMVDQIRLYRNQGGQSYPDLLRAVTTDRAMLFYLDGRTSTGTEPNENYARELMELFALGVGGYTEDDVKAAAAALTGWTLNRGSPTAIFRPFRHDDSPQALLGVDGVNDVDTVIDAVVGDPSHAPFVARTIVGEFLGDPDSPVMANAVEVVAAEYEAAGHQLDSTIATALALGLDGTTEPLVTAPVPWLVAAFRSTGAPVRSLFSRRGFIQAMGQVPFFPPNVAGWPGGTAWFTSSSLVARTNVAAAIATNTSPGAPIRIASDDVDLELLARLLGLGEPFSASTSAALTAASDPVERLTLALVSPENLLS